MRDVPVYGLFMSVEFNRYGKTSEQRAHWGRAICPLYKGCPLLGGFLLNLLESHKKLVLKGFEFCAYIFIVIFFKCNMKYYLYNDAVMTCLCSKHSIDICT